MALGINIAADASSSIPPMTQGRAMPLLQDTPAKNVVGSHGIAKDDLVILDRAGKLWRHQPTNPFFNFFTAPGPDTLEAWLKRVP